MSLKRIVWMSLCSALIVMGSTQAGEQPHVDHALWTEILRNNVNNGQVNYQHMLQHDRAKLSMYLQEVLGKVTRTQYSRWSASGKLAFWINAYNAFTVQLIVDHYPVKSIRSIGLLPGSAFRKRFISLPGMRRRKYSLDEIEHNIIRRQFSEPRIHFALVCAAQSCPVLRSEAYHEASLDIQLEEAVQKFMLDRSKNYIDGDQLYLSQIFRWFKDDFLATSPSIVDFVAPYFGIKAGQIKKVHYLAYDWSLNEHHEPVERLTP